MYSDGIVLINSIDDYKKYCEKYNCHSISELDDLLWYNYGVSLQISEPLRKTISIK